VDPFPQITDPTKPGTDQQLHEIRGRSTRLQAGHKSDPTAGLREASERLPPDNNEDAAHRSRFRARLRKRKPRLLASAWDEE
jgi:hypothetical protein